MLRSLIGEILLFMLPFGLFGAWLMARRRSPLRIESWSGSLFWLTVAGIAMAIAFLLYGGVSAERHRGAFEPPHMENGQLVPGRFRD